MWWRLTPEQSECHYSTHFRCRSSPLFYPYGMVPNSTCSNDSPQTKTFQTMASISKGMYRNFYSHGEHLLEYLVLRVVASHQESWFEALVEQMHIVIIFIWRCTHIEPLASSTGHHPDIVDYSMKLNSHYHRRCKFQYCEVPTNTGNLLWYMTSKVVALPDSKDIISQPHIEPGSI